MTTSQDLLALTVAAIKGPQAGATPPVYATDCGAAVYQPGDWPTQDGQYPRSKVRLVGEQKVSLGRGGPSQFTVTATIRILIEVSQQAQRDDAGAAAAEAELWRIVRQHEVAIINSYPLTGFVQQIPSVNTQLAFSSEQATHLAGAQMDVAMEFFQGDDMFAPLATDELAAVGATFPTFPGLAATLLPEDPLP